MKKLVLLSFLASIVCMNALQSQTNVDTFTLNGRILLRDKQTLYQGHSLISGLPGIDTTIVGSFSLTPNDTLAGNNLSITAKSRYNYSNMVNGVTTYDLTSLQRHILGISRITNPYKLIAADVNRSGTINSLDYRLIKRLILRVVNDFPNGESWVYVPAYFQFPDSTQPTASPWIDRKFNLPLTRDIDSLDYVAIKLGDIDGSASNSDFMATEEHGGAQFVYESEEQFVSAGEIFTFSLYPTEHETLEGVQINFEINTDLVEIENINAPTLENFDKDSWNQSNQNLYVSWVGEKATEIEKEKAVINVTGKAKQNCFLSNAIKLSQKDLKSEIYNTKNKIRPTVLNCVAKNLGNGDVSISPNPVGDAPAEISVNLASDASLSITLLDVLGRQVRKVYDGVGKVGANKFSFNSDGLMRGNYFMKVSSDGKILKTLKVTKL